MDMKEAQDKVREFGIARGWGNSWDLKDLMLNITEEGGELWNLIKWIDDEKQKEVLEEHKEEASDYIGDMLYLILKIAEQIKVDAGQALQNTLDEFEKRMPPEIMKKVKHSNKFAGGWDNKKALEEKKDE